MNEVMGKLTFLKFIGNYRGCRAILLQDYAPHRGDKVTWDDDIYGDLSGHVHSSYERVRPGPGGMTGLPREFRIVVKLDRPRPAD